MKYISMNLIGAAVLILISTGAAADDKEDARAAFKLGTRLFEQEKYAEAADAFQKSYDLRPSWKILLNIGQCNAAAKDYGRALEAFEAYLSEGGDDVPIEKRDEIIAEIRVMKELVGQLRGSAPEGAELVVDDTVRGTFPLPGPVLVSAGVNHEVRIQKNGEVLLERTLRINSGNTMELNVPKSTEGPPQTGAAGAAGGAAASNTGPADGSGAADSPAEGEAKQEKKRKKKGPYSKPLRIAAWTTTATGLALAVGGVATGFWVLSLHKDDVAGNCDDSCLQKMTNLQVTTNVLIGEGAGVTAIGVALLIVSYVKQHRAAKKLTLLPDVTPERFGLFATYEF